MLERNDKPGGAEHSRRSAIARGACRLAAAGMLLGGCTTSWPEPPANIAAEAIVVLGNRPPTDRDGRIQPETERRVRRGVELFERGVAPTMVMTGGPAPRGDIEAEVMRDLAIRLGVPADRIRIEPESTDTIENARFTRALFPSGATHPAIVLVTSPSHLGRALRLFECAGFLVTPAASAPPDSTLHRLGAALHEAVTALYYLTLDECTGTRSPSP